MDIAKGAAILATHEGSIHDYLAGRGEEIKEPVNPPTLQVLNYLSSYCNSFYIQQIIT